MFFFKKPNGLLPNRNAILALFFILASISTIRFFVLGFDSTAFMVHGQKFSVQGGPVDISIVDEGGYDGQFFGRLALDPFNTRQNSLGIKLDIPAYRYQRILYPFVAWTLALGQKRLVPYSLIIVNILSLTILGFLLLLLADKTNLNKNYLLFIPLLPGLIMALARDLSEPLATVLLVGALVSFLSSRYFVYGVLASLCVLCRETTLVFWASIGIVYVLSGSNRKEVWRFFFFLLPALTYGFWQWILYNIFGETAFMAGPKNFGYPFAGMMNYIFEIIPFMSIKEAALQTIYTAWLILLGFCSLKQVQLKENDIFLRVLSLSWISWVVIAMCFSSLIWEDDWSYCRVLVDWIICSYLIVLKRQERLPTILTLVSLAVCAGTLFRIMVKV